MKKKGWIWLLIVVVVLLVAGGGYLAYTRLWAAEPASEEPELQTASVYQGDIVLSALGSGNLLPEAEMDLVFDTSGLVAEVAVAVGDTVQAGDLLARLDTSDLQRAVTQAEISLRQAQIALESALEPPSEAEIQSAQDTLDQAAAALRLEQISYEGTMNGTLVTESLPDAQENYDARLEEYNYWLAEYNAGRADYWYVDRAQQRLEDAETQLARTQLQANQTVQSASNSLAEAVDRYHQAQASLEALLAEANELEIENLELKVQMAEMELGVAQENMANATLTAPFDGVVTAVGVEVGQMASSSTAAVTLADMDPPLMQFWVEEADMHSAVVGNPVSIVFEALPDLTFSGEVVRVEPTLVTVGSTTAVQLWASVDTSTYSGRLFSGMNAEVEILYGEARGALLVPVEALRELAPGQYAVFVIDASGEMELRPVEVGLQDYVNAEIVSGLALGEVVSAGVEDTALTASSSVDVNSPQMPGGGIFIPGGGGPP
ncbi:MAG: efflux RND transporter periplasmic adaptor subunit [Anaerolineae bacterium]|nr:efflux RND transporter periplasmic adaptor subunit [Anaerolineae bacterium]